MQRALPYLGDDLGQDCLIQDFVETRGWMFARSFRTDGMTNVDWFGWNQPVLMLCDGVITEVKTNEVTNLPGRTGKPPAAYIELRCAADDTYFMVAHVQSVSVKKGDSVKAGQSVARVGNNGYSRSPHVHIGAWLGKEALQIRRDQRVMRIP